MTRMLRPHVKASFHGASARWWLGEKSEDGDWTRIVQDAAYSYTVFGAPGTQAGEATFETLEEAIGHLIDRLRPDEGESLAICVPVDLPTPTGMELVPDLPLAIWSLRYLAPDGESAVPWLRGKAAYRSACDSILRTLAEKQADGATKWSGVESVVIDVSDRRLELFTLLGVA